MKKHFLFIYLIFIFLMAACSSQQATPQATLEPTAVTQTGVIVVGDVDADDPVSKLERFQPVADYLASNLGEFGIGIGEVKIATNLDTMSNWMESGEVDIYYDSLFPALVVSDQSGAFPTLRRWKDGSPAYHSVFFTRADSGIETLDDLKGRSIAYDGPNSTSGYLLPTAYLLSHGFNPVELSSEGLPVADDEIGYVFTEDDDNTIEWVLSGRIDAGVVDNLTYMDDIPEETQKNLLIFAETEDVARQIVLMSPTLSRELRDAVSKLLIELNETDEGREILLNLKTDRFDNFPEGADTAIESMRGFYNIVLGSND